MIQVQQMRVELSDWESVLPARLGRKGKRYGHLAVRRAAGGGRILEALILDPLSGGVEIVSAPIPDDCREFPSVTASLPAAHWAERLIGDFWALRATGHQRWKSLILHEAWPATEYPYAIPSDGPLPPREHRFMTVEGPGIHEIPVGPIHAGIIEPGHFRFSCLGEVITNLEIRLGYQHRGLEKRLSSVPLSHVRHVAESVSSDSAVANALAHAEAIESMLDVEVPVMALSIRGMALEIERIACHLGDLGGLAADLGYALGAGAFGGLRGSALGLAQTLAGSRFMRGFVCPGGIAWKVPEVGFAELEAGVHSLRETIRQACTLLLSNPGIQERMEGIGVLTPHLASEFGIVGPASRASGGEYDVRSSRSNIPFVPARQTSGDVYARARVRVDEIESSLSLMECYLSGPLGGPIRAALPDSLPPGRVGVGVVEAWRGELIHWITTDEGGGINRYCVRDPSFQNWTGLAIAARRNLVADFPVINKSFSLSYSGNDL